MANAFSQQASGSAGGSAGGETAASADVPVAITSEPEGADIEVDGSYEGSTPSQLSLAPAEYIIRVSRPGFKAWERRVIIKAGSAKTFNAILEKE
jgi:hypothetical protein